MTEVRGLKVWEATRLHRCGRQVIFIWTLMVFISVLYEESRNSPFFLVLGQSITVLWPESCLLLLWWDGIELRIRKHYKHMRFKVQAHTVQVVSWIFLEYLSWGGWNTFSIGDSIYWFRKELLFSLFSSREEGDWIHRWESLLLLWNQCIYCSAKNSLCHKILPFVGWRFYSQLWYLAHLAPATLCLSPGAKFIIALRHAPEHPDVKLGAKHSDVWVTCTANIIISIEYLINLAHKILNDFILNYLSVEDKGDTWLAGIILIL